MSPLAMLKSWGSSSRLARRRMRPSGVTRLSGQMEWKTKVEKSLTRWGGAQTSWAFSVIVRNLIMVKVLPRRPIRPCLNRAGPGDSSLTRRPRRAIRGPNTATPRKAAMRSKSSAGRGKPLASVADNDLLHGVAHSCDIGVGHAGEQGERQETGEQTVGVGEGARLKAERLLLVGMIVNGGEGHRGADAPLLQLLA